MQIAIDAGLPHSQNPQVQSVPLFRSLTWLAQGFDDLRHHWAASIAHGLLMAVLGWIQLFLFSNHPYFVLAAVSGFLLVAPVMSTGLCELSRRRALGESTTFDDSVAPLARDGAALFRFGAILAGIATAWFILSAILLKSVFHLPTPDLAQSLYRGLFDSATRPQILSYLAVGGVLAFVVFAVSVVSVPAIIDRRLSAAQAMHLSLKVLVANPGAMLVWSVLIVALTAVGFATFLFGMIVLIPVLGHATWHAYRDLVRE